MHDPTQMAALPQTARVVTGPGVWLEGDAVAQLARAAEAASEAPLARIGGATRAIGAEGA